MSLKHLILTEPDFRPPNWRQGLPRASIVPVTGVNLAEVPNEDDQIMVWVLTSVPEWENLVRQYSEHCPVIALSKITSLPEMQKALEAGARGYVEALANPRQLAQAASSVSQRALWIAAPMMDRLLGILSSALPKPATPQEWQNKLSKRELEVAEVVARGVSNREVAEELHITVRTVKEHLTSIFSKLGIQDRLHLILMARGENRSQQK